MVPLAMHVSLTLKTYNKGVFVQPRRLLAYSLSVTCVACVTCALATHTLSLLLKCYFNFKIFMYILCLKVKATYLLYCHILLCLICV